MTVTQLGYLAFEVRDTDAFTRFATDILGLTPTDSWVGGTAFTHDDRERRFVVREGDADDLAAAGWEVADGAALDALAGRLEAQGVPVTEASAADAAERGAERVLCFTDPAGVPLEAYCGPARNAVVPESPLVPSGFVAGALGAGHAVLTATDQAASVAFYTDVLGCRLSDVIDTTVAGTIPLKLVFLHANARHHSAAFGSIPLPKRMHHFMVEVGSVDDVGRALDRCKAAGVPLAMSLGRHPNDKMLSFYAQTPAGFAVEVGTSGRLIGDGWCTTTYDAMSEWGHHPGG